jgi:hypothetical protein
MMSSRHFTLEEANAAIAAIRPLMDEIQAIRSRMLSQRPEIWPALARSAGNGGNSKLSKLVVEFERLDRLVHQVQDSGAQIKDLDTGLLDFPAEREGRTVLLCWKHGEPEILFWHETDAGFAGRRPITEF